MPAILADDEITTWLTPGDIPSGQARAILQPFAPSTMQARDVSMRLNNARYDAPDVLIDNDPVQEPLF